MKQSMSQRSQRLSDKIWEKLDKEAESMGVTTPVLIRMIVQTHMKKGK